MPDNLEDQIIRDGMDTQNLTDIQYAIIGGILAAPEKAGSVIAKLPLDIFTENAAHELYDAISRLHFADKPVDRVTVRQEVGQGYAPVIDYCAKIAAPDLDYYGDILLESDMLWHVKILARQIIEARSMGEVRPMVDALNGRLCSRQGVNPVNAMELIRRYLQRKSDKTPPPEYITFGIAALDDALSVRPGDVVVIGGYASAGKTLLALQFAVHMAKKYTVGFFSLETNEDKLGERLISRYAEIDFRAIKRGTESQEDISRAVQLGIEIGDYKGRVEFIHAPGLSVRDIQAITLSRKYQIIFVDYLQIVNASGRDMRERVTEISMSLHTLAQTHKIAVVELAQLARPEKTKGKAAPPDMWSFKESGQIENDADVAMLLYPSDFNDNKSQRELKVSKNKDGAKVRLALDFDGAHQKLTPALRSMKEQYDAVFEASAKAVRDRRQATETDLEQVTMEPITGPYPNCPF